MNYKGKILQLLKKNNGIILTSQVVDQGVPKVYLTRFVRQGLIERIARGVYLDTDAFDDEMYRIQITYGRGIYSHGTALFLNDLTDVTPLQYSMTFPTGYHTPSIKKQGLTPFYVDKKKHEIGLISMPTSQGREVRTYNMERSIVDMIRSRRQLDADMVAQSLKAYVNRSDKALNTLMEYAEIFNVARILRERIEVLL